MRKEVERGETTKMSGTRKEEESVMPQKFLWRKNWGRDGYSEAVPSSRLQGHSTVGQAVGHCGWELGTGSPDLDLGLVNLHVAGVQRKHITGQRRAVVGEGRG